jgi:hypothetical protein
MAPLEMNEVNYYYVRGRVKQTLIVAVPKDPAKRPLP